MNESFPPPAWPGQPPVQVHQPPGSERIWGRGKPLLPACSLCGRGPAIEVELYKHTGIVLLARTETLKQPLCRECGLRHANEFLGWSLAAGWWSVLSLVMNPICILGDAAARRHLARLPAPSGSPVDPLAVSSRAARSAGRGTGVLLGIAVAVAVIALLAGFVALVLRVPAATPPLVIALVAVLASWFRKGFGDAASSGRIAVPLLASIGTTLTVAVTVAGVVVGPRNGGPLLLAGLVTAELTVAGVGLLVHPAARQRMAMALAVVFGVPLVAAGAGLAIALDALHREPAGLLFLLLTVLGAAYLPVRAAELGAGWARATRAKTSAPHQTYGPR
jgi:hypothetical protein